MSLPPKYTQDSVRPYDKLLISGSEDHGVHVWDSIYGSSILRLRAYERRGSTTLSFYYQCHYLSIRLQKS